MNITEVKVRKSFPTGNPKAIVSITIDNCLAVHDIKIVQGNDRIFAAMPSRKDENGVFRDIVHPIDPETRDEFDSIILSAYDRHVALEKIFDDMIADA
ncbi:MAG: SpoVG family protein [Oscillospiraceae bacterium]|nr:SpoVG family protein [Oscillospiraceae bacterium]